MKNILVVLFSLVMCACTAEGASEEALGKAGFYDIQMTGYSFFGCSEDDTFKTGFRAKNVNGMEVEGVVCCGVLKDCTIRF
jgi:hypothetical protein